MNAINISEEKKGEYLFIFKSIILSFAVYEYIKIFTLILKAKVFICFITPPSFLAFACFLILLEYWWDAYQDKFFIAKNFFWFMASIFEPLGFYLIAVLLNPNVKNIALTQSLFIQNYYFQKNSIYIIGILLLVLLFITSQDYTLNGINISRIIGIAIFISAIVFDNTIIHYVITILSLVFAIMFILIFCVDFEK